MKFKNLMIVSVFFALFANHANAWPRLFRGRSTAATYTEGGDNSTAQGVALIQAARCRLGHCGGYSGYEGVGKGSTADEAIANCCFWGKRTPSEIGVAVGSDNKFYACVRYQ